MPCTSVSPALRNHPIDTYSRIQVFWLKLLDFSLYSWKYSIFRWTVFSVFAIVVSNCVPDPSPQSTASVLAVAGMFLSAYLLDFFRGVLKHFGLSLKQLREKKNYYRQTRRYPQLPHKQDKYAMLSNCQWFRWECFVDAVFFNTLLGPLRVQAGDMRTVYHREGRKRLFDLSDRRDGPKSDSFWFDFFADSGDSFNGSYTVSCLLARDLNDLPGFNETLPRPGVVLHGGDVSYPWPAEHEMVNRFCLPLEYALPGDGSNQSVGDSFDMNEENGGSVKDNDEKPTMFILPGNHEWIDGLQLFNDMFVDKMSSLGQWSIPQESSYFVLRLPGNWWIFVVDCIDGAAAEHAPDVDAHQMEYFKDVYDNQVDKKRDSVIIATHIPDYFWNSILGYNKGPQLSALRSYLGENFAAMMTGDMHFYRRYAPETSIDKKRGVRRSVVEGNVLPLEGNVDEFPQLFIVGGGGGFSHSTANPKADKVKLGFPFEDEPKPFVSKKEFPSPKQCNDFFFERVYKTHHPGLQRMLGFLYMVFAAGYLPNRGGYDDSASVSTILSSALTSGKSFTSYPAVITLFIIFNAFNTANYSGNGIFFLKVASGALGFTALHVVCAAGILSLLLNHVVTGIPDVGKEDANVDELAVAGYYLAVLMLEFLLGGACGHVLVMTYFRIMFGYFNFHWNEAYCGIEDEDHKNFIRCRVNVADGSIDVHAIGINTVPKKWKENENKAENPCLLWPKDQDKIHPHLIEKVTIPNLVQRRRINLARRKNVREEGIGATDSNVEVVIRDETTSALL